MLAVAFVSLVVTYFISLPTIQEVVSGPSSQQISVAQVTHFFLPLFLDTVLFVYWALSTKRNAELLVLKVSIYYVDARDSLRRGAKFVMAGTIPLFISYVVLFVFYVYSSSTDGFMADVIYYLNIIYGYLGPLLLLVGFFYIGKGYAEIERKEHRPVGGTIMIVGAFAALFSYLFYNTEVFITKLLASSALSLLIVISLVIILIGIVVVAMTFRALRP